MGLREVRSRKNLTLEQVAFLAGCDPATISRWERGITTPEPALVVRLSQALGVPTRRLVSQKEFAG